MGLFVTFEGIEGSGKTTQIKKAGEYLYERNIPFILTNEPGGTDLGLELRKLLLNRASISIHERAELLLFAADRAQHVEEVIFPAIQGGKVVLCDRYSDATLAYQGYGRGLELKLIHWINDFAAQSLVPDLTILLDVPVDAGLKRVASRELTVEDHFENEHAVFHSRIRNGYLAMVKSDPARFRIVSGLRDVNDIHQEVCHHLAELIDR